MKRTILVILLSFLLPNLLRTENKFAFEVSSGYSIGLGADFKTSEKWWRIPPLSSEDKYYERYELGIPLRLGLKYYFSKRFAFQAEINYQKLTYHRWGGSVKGYMDEKKDESYIIPYLNGLYFFKEKGKITPFVGAGVGISHFVFYIPFPVFSAGGGLKYKLSQEVNMIIGINYYYGRKIYLGLRTGLEFK